jgi:Tol biopolymer transport system component
MKSLATALTLIIIFGATATAQTWDPETQLKIKALGTPRVSPDGKRMVYTVNEAVMTADKSEFVTQIWMANLATNRTLSSLSARNRPPIPSGRPTATGLPLPQTAKTTAIIFTS